MALPPNRAFANRPSIVRCRIQIICDRRSPVSGKRGFWRAVALAFNVHRRNLHEEAAARCMARFDDLAGDNFGYCGQLPRDGDKWP
jgi:hypothetical protein